MGRENSRKARERDHANPISALFRELPLNSTRIGKRLRISTTVSIAGTNLERVAELPRLKLKELCGYPSYGLKQY